MDGCPHREDTQKQLASSWLFDPDDGPLTAGIASAHNIIGSPQPRRRTNPPANQTKSLRDS